MTGRASYPPAVAELRARVADGLRERFGAAPTDAEGDFMVSLGPAAVWLRPTVYGGRALVRVWAVTNVDLSIDDALARHLMEANARLPFGGLGLDEAGSAVVFVDDLLGDYLTNAELALAVAVAGGVTAEVGPGIKDRFGGRLFGES